MSKIFSALWRIIIYGIILGVFLFVLLSIPLPLRWFPERVEERLAEEGIRYDDGYIIFRRGIFLRDVQWEREELRANTPELTLRVNLLAGILRQRLLLREISLSSLEIHLLQPFEELRETLEEFREPDVEGIMDWRRVYCDHATVKGELPYGEVWNFENVFLERTRDELSIQGLYELSPGDWKGSLRVTSDLEFQQALIEAQGNFQEISLPRHELFMNHGDYNVNVRKEDEAYQGKGMIRMGDVSWQEHWSEELYADLELSEYISGEDFIESSQGMLHIQAAKAEVFNTSLADIDMSLSQADMLAYYLREERGRLNGTYCHQNDLLDVIAQITFQPEDITQAKKQVPREVQEHLDRVAFLESRIDGNISGVRNILAEPSKTLDHLDLELFHFSAVTEGAIPPVDEAVKLFTEAKNFQWNPEKEFSWERLAFQQNDWGEIVLEAGEGSLPRREVGFDYSFALSEEFFHSSTIQAMTEDIEMVSLGGATGEGSMKLVDEEPYVAEGSLRAGSGIVKTSFPEDIAPYLEEQFALYVQNMQWDGKEGQAERITVQGEKGIPLAEGREVWSDLEKVRGGVFLDIAEGIIHTDLSKWVAGRLGDRIVGDFSLDIPAEKGDLRLENVETDFKSLAAWEKEHVVLSASLPGTRMHLDYTGDPGELRSQWKVEYDLIEKEVTEAFHRFMDEQLPSPWKGNIQLVDLVTSGNLFFHTEKRRLDIDATIEEVDFIFSDYEGKGRNIDIRYNEKQINVLLEQFRWGESYLEEIRLETALLEQNDGIEVDFENTAVSGGFGVNIHQIKDVFTLPDMKFFELERGKVQGKGYFAEEKLQSAHLELADVQAYSDILPYQSIFIEKGVVAGGMNEAKGTVVVKVDDKTVADVVLSHQYLDDELSLYFDTTADYFDLEHFIDNFQPGEIRDTFPEREPDEERLFRFREVQAMFDAEQVIYSNWDLSRSRARIYFSRDDGFFLEGRGDEVYGGQGFYRLTFDEDQMRHSIEVENICVQRYWREYMGEREPFLGEVDFDLEILGNEGEGDFVIHDFQIAQVELLSRMRNVIPPPFGAIVDELRFEELTGKFDVELEETSVKYHDILAENAFVRVYVQGNQVWKDEFLRLDMSFGVSTRYIRRFTDVIPGLSTLITLPFETVNRMFGGIIFLSYETIEGEDRFFVDTRVKDIFHREGIIRRHFGSD